MPLLTDNDPVVNDATWNAWIEKGKRLDKASARNMKIFAGIMAVLIAAGMWSVIAAK